MKRETLWCGCAWDAPGHLGRCEARARALRMEKRGALRAGVEPARVVAFCPARGRYRMEAAAAQPVRSPRRVDCTAMKGGER